MQEESKSIFEAQAREMFSWYEVTLSFHDKIMGGVPKNPKIIEGWLRSKAGVTDEEEIRLMTMRTLAEMGVEVSEGMSFEDMMKASETVAAERNTNGFKRDENGLFVESRQAKAMIKECVHILFAGEKWGRTRKGPLGFTAERVFVEPRRIYLDRQEPDGIDMFIGHVTGPQGPHSTLGYYEYCEKPVISFQVSSLRDEIKSEQWEQIWVQAERIGLGAVRSQGYGTFNVIRWEKIDAPKEVLRTKSGHILTDAEIEALANEAERGYDINPETGKLVDSKPTRSGWRERST